MKDNFSTQSDHYAKYRPTYPTAFFKYLDTIARVKQNAWDCGTGSGQVAFELSKNFQNVFATDISQPQIDNALQANNINYSLQASESTDFEDAFFDLITVAQAIHWFDFEKFYAEVQRTAKAGALICVMGYGRIVVSQEIDAVIGDFYTHVIGKYWDEERRYIDQNYQTIPFPFDEMQSPEFELELQWDFEHLIGYLKTWSAVQHFHTQNGYNPVDLLQAELRPYWKNNIRKTVRFPLLLRIGVVM